MKPKKLGIHPCSAANGCPSWLPTSARDVRDGSLAWRAMSVAHQGGLLVDPETQAPVGVSGRLLERLNDVLRVGSESWERGPRVEQSRCKRKMGGWGKRSQHDV